MKVEIKIDPSYTEPEVMIMTDEVTDRVREIVNIISETEHDTFTGFKNDTVTLIDQKDVFRIYASGGRVYAVTSSGEYVVRLRLYEAEEKLRACSFVRISNSEIINLKKVKNFDLSFSGTIYVKFSDGSSTYVSRRYVSKIKEVLGI